MIKLNLSSAYLWGGLGAILALILGGGLLLLDRRETAAYEAGRENVLLQLATQANTLREALRNADEGTGNAESDLDWIDRELDALGLRP